MEKNIDEKLIIDESIELKKTIASNLAELRKKNKYTQLELAEKLNYSDKAISKWERAEALPDITILVQLAKLYGVSIDYLISNEPEEEKEKYVVSTSKYNKIVITLLAAISCWVIAAVVFFYANFYNHIYYWMAFVWAVPATLLILLIFNSIWGKRKYKYALTSFLIWCLLTAIYLQLLKLNIWLIFIIGIPCQIACILWSQIRRN